MQCQGKTRLGRQCRNRALDGEMFCDVHMRVEHSRHLGVMTPLLLVAAGIYFFLLGLIIKTVIFAEFDLNYMEYAGLEDLLLQTLRVGLFALAALFSLWLIYAVLLAVIFLILLGVRIFKNSNTPNLGVWARLRLVGLSLGVFCFNFLIRLISLIPALQSRIGDRISTRRDNISNELFNAQSLTPEEKAARPIRTAREMFERYLYFRNFGYHCFLMSTLVLLLFSLGITISAFQQSRDYKACAESANFQDGITTDTPDRGFLIGKACNAPGTIGANYLLDIQPVTLKSGKKTERLLHLASTSRFHILYDGQDRKTRLLPSGLGTEMGSLNTEEMEGKIARIEGNVSNLEVKVDQSLSAIKDLEELVRKNLAHDQMNSKQLADLVSKLPEASFKGQKPSKNCMELPPMQIIAFDSGSAAVEGEYLLKRLKLLSEFLIRNPTKKVILAGFADKSGQREQNNKLSRLRAQRIAEKIESYGVATSRLIQIGMGEAEDGNFPERRVEIRVCEE